MIDNPTFPSKKPYVYLAYNSNNEIVYVGQTISIHGRIYNHWNDDYWWRTEVCKIEYAIANSFTDMIIYEVFYINKYKPIYNRKDKFVAEDFCTLKLPELSFGYTETIVNGKSIEWEEEQKKAREERLMTIIV